jgi:hypothetical protein
VDVQKKQFFRMKMISLSRMLTIYDPVDRGKIGKLPPPPFYRWFTAGSLI